jgi:hypothetical protein
VLTEASVGQLRAGGAAEHHQGNLQTIPSRRAPHRVDGAAARRPRIIRNLEWNGPRPFRAFVFEIDEPAEHLHLHQCPKTAATSLC